MPIDFQPFLGSDPFRRINLGIPSWPGWAKLCLFIPMIPGILLLGFAILAVGVSILALFILTVPVYMLLTRILGVGRTQPTESVPSSGRKTVAATVRDV